MDQNPPLDDELLARLEICKKHHLEGLLEAHRLIAGCARQGIGGLIRQGLKAKELEGLGYSLSAMKQLGYSDSDLEDLGFHVSLQKKEKEPVASEITTGTKDELDQLIAAGTPYDDMMIKGYGVHRCKTAGCSASDLVRLGFPLGELAKEFSARQLKNEGFSGRELLQHFPGSEIRQCGFTTRQLKNEGFGIDELRSFGYSENELVDAHYSNLERMKAGLRKRTKLEY